MDRSRGHVPYSIRSSRAVLHKLPDRPFGSGFALFLRPTSEVITSSIDFPSDSACVQLLGLTDESEDIVTLIASFHVLSTCQHGGQLAEQVGGFGCRITSWTDATALQAQALDAPGIAAALNF
ncbi:hypothetical protein T05_8333 [Trichinella murrelli]|uniref:Uncharacterized protein n=1 Tax=Trichinella murrelli TaxID=144512 RepID=A0A0V0TCH8_9BILA|nr:hypothetical protein T05_8333 [Trichinella murrelli]